MQFTKLNIGWDAEPNAPEPTVEIDNKNNKITLSFYLNYFIHNHVKPDDIGIIEFIDCYMYRLGPTNDEGFYMGECRFSKTGIKWGDFYLMFDSNWQTDFPEDRIIVNDTLKENLNHYLFYFRDNTFEAIAKNFIIKVKRDGN